MNEDSKEARKEARQLESRILQGKVNIFDILHYAEEEGREDEMKTAEGRAQLENEIYANNPPSRRHIPGGGTVFR